ncbi:hypothetical protein chiPu_0031215, partial [Chiloscyllium punctatum]|nr:hypothetical protein [Chiloscyllium punctatum]
MNQPVTASDVTDRQEPADGAAPFAFRDERLE